MSPMRKQCSEEFKHEAVRLMLEGGVPLSQVSRDLGVCTNGCLHQCSWTMEACRVSDGRCFGPFAHDPVASKCQNLPRSWCGS